VEQPIVNIRKKLAAFPRAITTEELSNLLAISKRTIQRWTRLGSLPCLRLGGQIRFCPKEVSDWLDKR
jgi:excisionase family DNA binding protein